MGNKLRPVGAGLGPWLSPRQGVNADLPSGKGLLALFTIETRRGDWLVEKEGGPEVCARDWEQSEQRLGGGKTGSAGGTVSV